MHSELETCPRVRAWRWDFSLRLHIVTGAFFFTKNGLLHKCLDDSKRCSVGAELLLKETKNFIIRHKQSFS